MADSPSEKENHVVSREEQLEHDLTLARAEVALLREQLDQGHGVAELQEQFRYLRQLMLQIQQQIVETVRQNELMEENVNQVVAENNRLHHHLEAAMRAVQALMEMQL